ncbi:MAG: peptide ABC transporter substrate-binding protein [Opitutaceae bacterium]|nr:peptide ABC transporter substrate-binding protein [Opitutaceae bacterium]
MIPVGPLRSLPLGCLLGATLLGLAACSRPSPPPATERVLRVSQRNEPATLDPQLATLPDEFFIIRAVGEGLLVPAPGSGDTPPLPGVAESWTVSDDGCTYTFHLRAGARWSNGDPVTAVDFAYSVQRALTPALGAPKAALFFGLKHAAAYHAGRVTDFSAVGVRVINPRTLQLELEHPAADFPVTVASGPWIPVHRATVERFGAMDQRDNPWTKPGHHVGNGPFTLSGWLPAQEIAVRRHAGYWDSARVKLDGIRFLVFDNGDTEERAFRAGQVDVTMAVPFSKLAGYRAAQPSPLRTAPLHETRYLALNTERAPLDLPAVRRALSLALDRSALVEKVLQGGQHPAYSFLPPGLGGYQDADRITEDAAEARRLLAEAGFPGGAGFPVLEVTSWWASSAVLEAIQQMWRRELGIEVTLAQREARAHLAAMAAGDYAIAFVTAIPDCNSVTDLLTDLTSGNPGNYPRWSNPDYDRLVTEGSRLNSASNRLAAYQAAERLLLADSPVIPLYFNTQNFLVQPRVKVWQTDRLWTRFYKDVTLE